MSLGLRKHRPTTHPQEFYMQDGQGQPTLPYVLHVIDPGREYEVELLAGKVNFSRTGIIFYRRVQGLFVQLLEGSWMYTEYQQGGQWNQATYDTSSITMGQQDNGDGTVTLWIQSDFNEANTYARMEMRLGVDDQGYVGKIAYFQPAFQNRLRRIRWDVTTLGDSVPDITGWDELKHPSVRKRLRMMGNFLVNWDDFPGETNVEVDKPNRQLRVWFHSNGIQSDIDIDPAIYFDGDGDYIEIASGFNAFGAVMDASDWCIEFFIKHTAAGAWVCGTMNVGANTMFLAVTNYATGGDIFAKFRDEDGQNLTVSSGDQDINDGNWHHVAFEYITSTHTLYVFVDGSLCDSNSSQIPDNTTDFTYEFLIGCGNDEGTPTSHFTGAIDEFRVSDCQRSVGGSFPVPLQPYSTDGYTWLLYHLDSDAGGGTVADSSGNGYTGTLYGDPTFGAGAPWTYTQAAAGTLGAVAGALTKETQTGKSGTMGALTGALARTTSKTGLSGTLGALAGDIVKQTSKVGLAGTMGALSGVGAGIKIALAAVSGTLGAMTGGLTRTTGKQTAGTMGAVSGDIARQTHKQLDGTMGAMTGQVSKGLWASLTGTLGALTGDLAAQLITTTFQAVDGVLGAMSGALTTVVTHVQSNAGTLGSMTGDLVKQTQKYLLGKILDFDGTLVKMTSKAVEGTMGSLTGTLGLPMLWLVSVAGTLGAVAGNLSRMTQKTHLHGYLGYRQPVGNDPLDRASSRTMVDYAYVDEHNVAKEYLDVTQVIIFANQTIANCRVGSAYWVPIPGLPATAMSIRDWQHIGTVLAGTPQIFSVDLTFYPGDAIAISGTTGAIEMDTTGGTVVRGFTYKDVDYQIPFTNKAPSVNVYSALISVIGYVKGTLGEEGGVGATQGIHGGVSKGVYKAVGGTMGTLSGTVGKFTRKQLAGALPAMSGAAVRYSQFFRSLAGVLGALYGTLTAWKLEEIEIATDTSSGLTIATTTSTSLSIATDTSSSLEVS